MGIGVELGGWDGGADGDGVVGKGKVLGVVVEEEGGS